jgi:hypothetical protein
VLRILAALTIDSGTANADAQHTITGLVESGEDFVAL